VREPFSQALVVHPQVYKFNVRVPLDETLDSPRVIDAQFHISVKPRRCDLVTLLTVFRAGVGIGFSPHRNERDSRSDVFQGVQVITTG
jgi:hypothetical protein